MKSERLQGFGALGTPSTSRPKQGLFGDGFASLLGQLGPIASNDQASLNGGSSSGSPGKEQGGHLSEDGEESLLPDSALLATPGLSPTALLDQADLGAGTFMGSAEHSLQGGPLSPSLLEGTLLSPLPQSPSSSGLAEAPEGSTAGAGLGLLPGAPNALHQGAPTSLQMPPMMAGSHLAGGGTSPPSSGTAATAAGQGLEASPLDPPFNQPSLNLGEPSAQGPGSLRDPHQAPPSPGVEALEGNIPNIPGGGAPKGVDGGPKPMLSPTIGTEAHGPTLGTLAPSIAKSISSVDQRSQAPLRQGAETRGAGDVGLTGEGPGSASDPEASLLSLLNRPKAPLGSGSFYGASRRRTTTYSLDALNLGEPEGEDALNSHRPATPTEPPGNLAAKASSSTNGAIIDESTETEDTRHNHHRDAKVEAGPLGQKPKLPTPRPLNAPSTPTANSPLGQGLEGQANQALNNQPASGTERLQALRETQLPRILEAMQVKITQLGQTSDSHLPARAVLDVRDPQLGRLRLDLSMKEGKLSIQVQHATPEVQAMLESSHSELQEHLQRQGLSLGEFSSGGQGSEGDGQQGRQNQGGRQGTHEHDPDANEAPPKPSRRSAPSQDGLIDTVI